ncbi:MAG: PhoD-like phosphatase N-terminal domain-containing protein [Thermoleophilaceae bacterium]
MSADLNDDLGGELAPAPARQAAGAAGPEASASAAKSLRQSMSRRRFLATSAAGAVGILAPQSVAQARVASRADRSHLLAGGQFSEGVLSGDPTPDGITLLSRLGCVEAPGQVLIEVATDPGFSEVVASQKVNTSDNVDHNVKARVTGLRPGERYYYRFAGKTAESPVGRFQTALPASSNEPVKFAFFSCQEFASGYFNAHTLLADEEVDFIVNLGDYIYSDYGLVPPLAARPLPNLHLLNGFLSATTFEAYCERYKDYRTDANLRAMHASFPMISGVPPVSWTPDG